MKVEIIICEDKNFFAKYLLDKNSDLLIFLSGKQLPKEVYNEILDQGMSLKDILNKSIGSTTLDKNYSWWFDKEKLVFDIEKLMNLSY